MFQISKCSKIFRIEIPISQQDDFENFIYTQWLERNKTQKDFIIVDIKKITQKSQLEVVKLDFNHSSFVGTFELELEVYQLMPGQCVDLSKYSFQRINTLGEENVIYEQIKINDIQCVRVYSKNSPSTIYSVKISQNYKNCLFYLQQIPSGYQAYTLTLESGLYDYAYPKENVEASKNAKVKPKLQAEGFDLHEKYTLEDFMKWCKENKEIKAPQNRIDKSVLVSKVESTVKHTKKQYENLYWLIQLQQKFINECLDKKSTDMVQKGGRKLRQLKKNY